MNSRNCSPSIRIAIAEPNTGTRWKNGAAQFGPIRTGQQ